MSESSVAGPSSNDSVSVEDEMSLYKKSALDVVKFRIVYDKDDLMADYTTFKPQMAHQIFEDNESIFGYKTLTIAIYYLHNSCRCYVRLFSKGRINKPEFQADDLVAKLDPWLPKNWSTNFKTFEKWFDEEEHDKIYGKLIHTFHNDVNMKRFPKQQVPVEYRITCSRAISVEIREFHKRFQTYIPWFIDAANYIDLDDDRWIVYYVYEEFVHPIEKKIYRSPVAYCTVYNFYAYPCHIRSRISQFFVLPSHQKMGIGTTLYETVARGLRQRSEVIDITVEDPSMEFRRIRDLEDCGIIHQTLIKNNINFFTTSKKILFDIGYQKKIWRKTQMQRVYDILGLMYALELNEAHYRSFLEGIKTRIQEAHERECRPGKQFCGVQVPSLQGIKEDSENEFREYTNTLFPSLEYVKKKLNNWLERAAKNNYS